MARIRSSLSGGGSGGGDVYYGTFTANASTTTVIHDCGFEPSMIIVIGTSTSAAVQYYVLWDKAGSDTYQCQTFYYKPDGLQPAATRASLGEVDNLRGVIVSVDSTGFTFSRVTGNANFGQEFAYLCFP